MKEASISQENNFGTQTHVVFSMFGHSNIDVNIDENVLID